ncbi:hypothetical protein [Kordia sp.]|uniref:hypothetical protein n=1 Tax=Kordia sp. TaxID=1965332 RepID=UPI003B5929FD
MKRVRNVFQFLCILVVMLACTNCQNDTEIETQHTEGLQKEFPYRSSVLTKQAIEINTKLSNQMRSITGIQNDELSKSVYNSVYDFTVYTDVINFVESTENNKHSYTFPIERGNNTGSSLENLVLSYDETIDDYTASIVAYHFTASQKQEFLENQHVSTSYGVSFETVAVNANDVLNKNGSLPCTTTYTVYHVTPDTGETFVHSTNNQHNECEHEDADGNTQCRTYTVIEIDCPDGGNSNGLGTEDNSGSTSSPNTGGSSGNNNDNDNDFDDIVTTPAVMPDQMIDDCMNTNSFNPRLSPEIRTWLRNNRIHSSALSRYLQNVGCNDSSKDFIEAAIIAMMDDQDLTFEDYIRLRVEEKLEERPFGLIEVPCVELEKWQALALHNPPPSVVNRVHAIDNQDTTFFTDYSIQTLENAEGHLVNMDYFPVEISSFPINPSTNLPYTPEEFLTYFRLNINSLIDNTWAVFNPVVYQNGNFSIDDTELWNSDNPLTALLTIDIPVDEGTVIISDYSDSNFTVITLETPWDSEHPVSGVRDFGFTQTNWGSYVFYSRAVDRMANGLDYAVANSPIPNDVAFFGSDALWESFQEKMITFVNENGGNAQMDFKESYRPSWEKIKKVLRGEISIDELDCLN